MSPPTEPVKIPDTLTLALLLLPGFVSQGVVRYYATSPQLGEIETIASALVFTLFDFVTIVLMCRVWALCRGREQPALGVLVASPWFLCLLLATALVVGAAWTVIDERDWLFRIPLTERTSRADVWDKTLQESVHGGKRHAIVTATNGHVYSGIVRFISEGNSDFVIFLRPAFTERVAATEGDDASRDGTGLAPSFSRCAIVGGLLIPKSSILLVSFRDPLKDVVEPCTDAELAASLRGSSVGATAPKARASRGKPAP